MIHYEHPALVWLLLLIPAATAIYILLWLRRQRRLRAFADAPLHGLILPESSRRRPHVKFSLLMLAAACLILAWANPQVGTRMVKGERLGSDIAVCLDVSRSMMAEDVSPNRLERSKRTLSTLLDKLGNDKVSLILFAGSSYIQMPLTNDYNAARMFVDQTCCELIAAQGTAIGDAIHTAMQSFGYGDEDREWEKRQSRCILVISDGENFEDDAVAAAREAQKEGVMVCCIGMGGTKGTPIPDYRDGKNVGYRHDQQGNVVTTTLNEQMLIDIAKAGGGIYVRSGNIAAGVDELMKELDRLEKDNYGATLFSEYESRYHYPLALALILLLAEMLLLEKKNPRLQIGKILRR